LTELGAAGLDGAKGEGVDFAGSGDLTGVSGSVASDDRGNFFCGVGLSLSFLGLEVAEIRRSMAGSSSGFWTGRVVILGGDWSVGLGVGLGGVWVRGDRVGKDVGGGDLALMEGVVDDAETVRETGLGGGVGVGSAF
jgi:hypothetical protein